MSALSNQEIEYFQTVPASDPVWQKAQRDVRRTIALDFDGVLHAYSKGWHDGTIYDEPVPGAVGACLALSQQFYLVVFTARRDTAAVSDWLARHHFAIDRVTNTKPPALVYIDDRAIRFLNWDDCICKLNLLLQMGAGEP